MARLYVQNILIYLLSIWIASEANISSYLQLSQWTLTGHPLFYYPISNIPFIHHHKEYACCSLQTFYRNHGNTTGN